MVILGVNVGVGSDGRPINDGGACLAIDGEVVGAMAEERITRVKHQGGYAAATAHLLAAADLDPGDVDLVSVSSYGDEPRLDRFGDLGLDAARRVEMVPSHHLSHACSAFFPSGCERALVIVADNEGNILGKPRYPEMWRNSMERLSMWQGEATQVRLLEYDMDAEDVVSLGELYGNVTRYVGLGNYLHAGKTMALAAYGNPERFAHVPLVERMPEGRLRCPIANAYKHSTAELCRYLTAHGVDLPAARERQVEDFPQGHLDLAAAAQRQLEDGLVHKVRHWTEKTGIRSLCLAGGVALNCIANLRLLEETPIERLYVQPNAGDQGQGLGNVLWAWHHLLGHSQPLRGSDGVYLGGRYDAARCLDAAQAAGRGFRVRTVPDSAAVAASALASGQVVGWFQGRSEWGPRALGNRSILADPRDPSMRDHVNRNVKDRESFRPFAPAVLEGHVADLFDPRGASTTMTLAMRARPAAVRCIPAVVHVDGTARAQVVTREKNPRLHAVLSRFAEETGVPTVLNTSFNLRDEPIVETPEDAMASFSRSAIDVLVMEDVVVERVPAVIANV